ncbi:hypothetical protein F5Y19DRAFT_270313 [Xylariaceae sp. FL1651]|nr:hypothetical protein F5Y19DRAFT_270313 [Xylariaceae sp. FL1651]
MEDKKTELLQYARDFAAANKDLYELLSISPDAAQPEVHRAWRKTSLKHHPDKAKNFDPEIWQLFERARDVLSTPEPRAAYDSARAAAIRAQKARAALDSKRREMIEDLEARERGVKRKAPGGESGRHMMTEAEKKVLLEKGNRRLEERRRLMAEAEARERQRERERIMKEKLERGKEDGAAALAAQRRHPRPDFVNTHANADSARTESPDAPQPPPPDEYDERIADIERKLQERKAEKAARKAEKKQHKAQKNEMPSAGEGPTPAITTTSLPSTGTAAVPVPKSVPIHVPPPKTTPVETKSAPGDFSSTMAKLRAAQREKERKKAEAAAAAAAIASGSRE